jgi:hypothetical protein
MEGFSFKGEWLEYDIEPGHRIGEWFSCEASLTIEVRDHFFRDAMSVDRIDYAKLRVGIKAADIVRLLDAPNIE